MASRQANKHRSHQIECSLQSVEKEGRTGSEGKHRTDGPTRTGSESGMRNEIVFPTPTRDTPVRFNVSGLDRR